jgi:hypothetical protein
MDLTATIAAMTLTAAVLAFASWRASKPATPLKVRLVPWRLIIFVSGCVLILLGVHLLTMLGLKTDMPR